MQSPDDSVRATYEAVRRTDARAFFQRLTGAERTEYLQRIRQNNQGDQEELASLLAAHGKALPSLEKLDDQAILDLIIGSIPAWVRNVHGEVFRSVFRSANTCLVRVRTGRMGTDGTVDMNSGFDEEKQFPQGQGVLQDELTLRLEAGEWKVVPWPFGIIPLPGYANVMYFAPSDHGDARGDDEGRLSP